MSDEICRICLEDCGHEPDCPEGMVEDLQSDLDQLQAENDSLAAEIEQLTKDRDEARAAKAKWIMQHGIATSEIGQLQRYKEFAMKCAAVNNHAGWQGAYFREAQALFLPTKDGDELPPLQKMPPVAGKLREARRMSLPPGLDETGKDANA